MEAEFAPVSARLFLKEKFRLSLRFMLFPAEKTMPLPNCIPDK